jgi:hypothetical protein
MRLKKSMDGTRCGRMSSNSERMLGRYEMIGRLVRLEEDTQEWLEKKWLPVLVDVWTIARGVFGGLWLFALSLIPIVRMLWVIAEGIREVGK